MPGKRKEVEKFILDGIARISAHPENVKMYKDKFASMNDKQFEQFVNDLRERKISLSIVEPNMTDRQDVPRQQVVDYARELGHEFMQHIYVEGREDFPTYKTPVKYPVYLVNARRASQSLTKKISVPPHTKVRDLLTGQVTGESKGASVSGPENQLLGAMGAMNSAVEMNKYRAGDARGEAAFTALLSKTGRASQQVLEQYASGVQVGKALRTFLTAAMHRVNL